MPVIDSLDGIDAPKKLPPFWGKSYWWTRIGGLIGLASLIFGAFMVYRLDQHVGPCDLARQLTTPTLAIEVAWNRQEILGLVGTCEIPFCKQGRNLEACDASGNCRKIVCFDKIDAFHTQQYQDFVFIILYWLSFVYLGIVNWNFCYWRRYPRLTQAIGKVFGAVTIAAATYGAFNDWNENLRILQALANLHSVPAALPTMRYFAYIKWQFLFLAIGAASPLFIFWPGKSRSGGVRPSAFSQFAAWTTAVLAISTAWTGVAACVFGDDHRMEVATKRLILVIFASAITLLTAQFWRGGTIAALDRLAKPPLVSRFANLFSSEDVTPQTPDTDPNRML